MTPEQWPPSLEEVARARLGDPKAVEAIYRAVQPRLNAFLRYHGFDLATREDIAADVSEIVLSKIDTLRQLETFEAWFWTITRNQVRAWLRRKQRASRHTEPHQPAPTPPDETVVIDEEHLTIRRALTRLSEADRHLLWLREVEGLTYKEISNRLDAASGAIRVRCHRARQRLEAAYEHISKHGDPPDGTAGA